MDGATWFERVFESPPGFLFWEGFNTRETFFFENLNDSHASDLEKGLACFIYKKKKEILGSGARLRVGNVFKAPHLPDIKPVFTKYLVGFWKHFTANFVK